MKAERACEGCDGTGELEAKRATPIPDEPTRGHFWRCGTCGSQNTEMDGTCQFCECGGTACTRWNCDDHRHFPPCPACLGTGRVVDHIPAADAVADELTLQRVASAAFPAVYSATRGRLEVSGAAWGYMLPGINGGILASDLKAGYLSRAHSLAVNSARAAFRAVPGLRD